ncbi:unnamed protein product [Prunus brigantina]
MLHGHGLTIQPRCTRIVGIASLSCSQNPSKFLWTLTTHMLPNLALHRSHNIYLFQKILVILRIGNLITLRTRSLTIQKLMRNEKLIHYHP